MFETFDWLLDSKKTPKSDYIKNGFDGKGIYLKFIENNMIPQDNTSYHLNIDQGRRRFNPTIFILQDIEKKSQIGRRESHISLASLAMEVICIPLAKRFIASASPYLYFR